MLATVENIFKRLSPGYRLRRIAGENGLGNMAKWASVVEDDDIKKMRNTKAIVFTAGMRNNAEEDYLLNFAQKLHTADTAAFVINTGPYVRTIPDNLRAYCDQMSFPLYTLPEGNLMVDVVRDICRIIIYEETLQSDIAGAIQSIIFKTDSIENQMNILERHGYSTTSMFRPLIFKMDPLSSAENYENIEIFVRELEVYCNTLLHNGKSKSIPFIYNHNLILILADWTDGAIHAFIDRMYKNLPLRLRQHTIHVCVGPGAGTIYSLSNSFKKTLPMTRLTGRGKPEVMFYDRLGMYKLIAEINNHDALKEFYDRTVGELARHDQETGSELVRLLRTFIDGNGNTLAVSRTCFLHRNTVNNHLKKIKKLTGVDPLTIDGTAQFLLAFRIMEFCGF